MNAFGLHPLKDSFCLECANTQPKKKKSTIGCIWSYYKISLKPYLGGMKAEFDVLEEQEMICNKCAAYRGSIKNVNTRQERKDVLNPRSILKPRKRQQNDLMNKKMGKAVQQTPQNSKSAELQHPKIHHRQCPDNQEISTGSIFKELLGQPHTSDSFQPLDFDLSHFEDAE